MTDVSTPLKPSHEMLAPDEPTLVPAQQRMGRIVACLTTSGMGATEFETTPCDSLALDHEGIIGNRHRGWLRKADARVPYLKRGTPIRNTRMLSIVSVADLATASERLGVARIDPAWVGANLLVDGLAWFSYLPRGTKLFFADDVILTIEDQNAPCRIAGAAIARHTGQASAELGFAKVCQGLRGVVVSVERPGMIVASGALTARIPAQWLYPA